MLYTSFTFDTKPVFQEGSDKMVSSFSFKDEGQHVLPPSIKLIALQFQSGYIKYISSSF